MALFGDSYSTFDPAWIVRMGTEELRAETEVQSEGVEWKTIYKYGVDGVLEAQFRAAENVLSFEFNRIKSVSITIELSCGSSPLLQDIDGVRTYALKDGILQSICQLVESRYNEDRVCELPTGEGGCDPLLVKISRDGSHSLGLCFESCSFLVTDHNLSVSSIGASFDESDEPIRGIIRMTEDEAEALIQLCQLERI
jgi:hypothetical protein